MQRMVVAAALIVRASFAAICTTAPHDRHFATTWKHEQDRGCYLHRMSDTKYTSLRDAQRDCERSVQCSGVHDNLCGGFNFYLCDAAHPIGNVTDTISGPAPCVYAKPVATATKKASGSNLSATVEGYWCSTWCCCPPNFHGLRCDDFDECAASPCTNGGTCTESFTDTRVNDEGMWKYRCECPSGFEGHRCEHRASSVSTRSAKCQLPLGTSSVGAAISSPKAYHRFQRALTYLDVTISSNTDYERMCGAVYMLHSQGGFCGQRVTIYRRGTDIVIATPLVNCHDTFEGLVALKLCTFPCIDDPTSRCCFIGPEFAHYFPCCRELGCCPDQLLASRGKQLAKAVRHAQSVSVSVAVDVEGGSASRTRFDSLVKCLAASHGESETAVARCTKGVGTSGHRLLWDSNGPRRLFGHVPHHGSLSPTAPGYAYVPTTSPTPASPTASPTAYWCPPSTPWCSTALGAMGGVPARTYYFRTAKLSAIAAATNPSYSSLMIAECAKYNMKPVCDNPRNCKNDRSAVYIGQHQHLAYRPHRNIISYFPSGWSATLSARWDGLCAYTARGNGNNALCNIPSNSHAWKSPSQYNPGFVCATTTPPPTRSPTAPGYTYAPTTSPTASPTDAPCVDRDPKACPAAVAALRAKGLTCANATDGFATARRCCYSCADRGMCARGTQVTCEDGVLNGDELSIDCGGSCGTPQGTACTRGFAAAMRALRVGRDAGLAVRRDLTAADFARFGMGSGVVSITKTQTFHFEGRCTSAHIDRPDRNDQMCAWPSSIIVTGIINMSRANFVGDSIAASVRLSLFDGARAVVSRCRFAKVSAIKQRRLTYGCGGWCGRSNSCGSSSAACGVVYVAGAKLYMESVQFLHNDGGALIVASGRVSLVSMVFMHNRATGSNFNCGRGSTGAAIHIFGGSVSISKSQLINNTVEGSGGWSGGGAIYVRNGSVSVIESQFRKNRAAQTKWGSGSGSRSYVAGAICAEGLDGMNTPVITVSKCTFADNVGGWRVWVGANGGAIIAVRSVLNVSNSVFVNNSIVGRHGQNLVPNAINCLPGSGTGYKLLGTYHVARPMSSINETRVVC